MIPVMQALLAKGASLGTSLAFMMSVVGLSAAGDDLVASRAAYSPHRNLCRSGFRRDTDYWVPVQLGFLRNSAVRLKGDKNECSITARQSRRVAFTPYK
jgi:hypothetical protein